MRPRFGLRVAEGVAEDGNAIQTRSWAAVSAGMCNVIVRPFAWPVAEPECSQNLAEAVDGFRRSNAGSAHRVAPGESPQFATPAHGAIPGSERAWESV